MARIDNWNQAWNRCGHLNYGVCLPLLFSPHTHSHSPAVKGPPKTSDTVAAANLHNNLKFSASNERRRMEDAPSDWLPHALALWLWARSQFPVWPYGYFKFRLFWLAAINRMPGISRVASSSLFFTKIQGKMGSPKKKLERYMFLITLWARCWLWLYLFRTCHALYRTGYMYVCLQPKKNLTGRKVKEQGPSVRRQLQRAVRAPKLPKFA